MNKWTIGFWLLLTVIIRAQGLEFTETLKNVNASADATIVSADFHFSNKSNKPITIAKTDSGCSCLKIEMSDGKLKYLPGESGVLRTTFEVGNFSGTVDKIVALWLNNDAPDQPSKQLTVRVHIPILVGIEPKTVKWEVGDKLVPQTIQIRMAEGKLTHVVGVKSSSNLFSCELKTLIKGKQYDLIVTPKSLENPGMSVIRIETDCEVSKHRIQQAFAVIRKPMPKSVVTKP